LVRLPRGAFFVHGSTAAAIGPPPQWPHPATLVCELVAKLAFPGPLMHVTRFSERSR
jgi:hypothetical protein